jgi:hypothetical protein
MLGISRMDLSEIIYIFFFTNSVIIIDYIDSFHQMKTGQSRHPSESVVAKSSLYLSKCQI